MKKSKYLNMLVKIIENETCEFLELEPESSMNILLDKIYKEELVKVGKILTCDGEILDCSGDYIQDTILYDQAEIHVDYVELNRLFVPKGFYLVVGEHSISNNDTSVYHLLQSYYFISGYVLPFEFIGTTNLHEFGFSKIIKGRLIEIKQPDFLTNDISQVKSDFFQFDRLIEKKILVDELPKMKNHINFLLKYTGSVMAGSYPLSKIVKNIRPRDVDIFSFTLDFLRSLLMNPCILREYTLKINNLVRFESLDSYNVFARSKKNPNENFMINFVHIGDGLHPEDIDLSTEENREKTMNHIRNNFDFTACMTCYDGKFLHYNSHAEDRVIYHRHSNNARIQKYISRGFEMIPIPGIILKTDITYYEHPIMNNYKEIYRTCSI